MKNRLRLLTAALVLAVVGFVGAAQWNPSTYQSMLNNLGLSILADGSADQPTYSFASCQRCGLWWDNVARALKFSIDGTAVQTVGAGGATSPGAVYSGTAFGCYGDSFAYGTVGGGIGPDGVSGYCYQIAKDTGMTMTMRGGNGAASDNEPTFQALPRTIGPSEISVSNIGSSDYVHYPSGLAADFYSYTYLVQSALAWLAVPEVSKIKASDSRIVYTGTWLNSPGPAGVYGFQTRYTTGVGNTATVSISGTAVYIWYDQWITSAAMGGATVSVDGINYGSISAAGHRVANPDQSTTFRAEMFRVGNLSPGNHTVVVTTTAPTDGTHYIELLAFAGAGVYSPSSQTVGMPLGPTVYTGNGQRLNAAGYAFYSTTEARALQFNDLFQAIIRTLAGDGLRIQWVNSMDAYEPLSTTCGAGGAPDQVHPTICGHRRIADAFEREINQAGHVGQWNSAWNWFMGRIPFSLGAGSIPKTAAYTVRINDDIVLGDTTSSAFAFTMPTAVGLSGTYFTFINVRTGGVNALTVNSVFSQTFKPIGGTSIVLSQQGELVTVVSDGANWNVTNRYIPTQIDGVASLAAEVSVTNSVTDTPVLAYTIPANTSFAGTTYRIVVYGNSDNAAAGQALNFWVKDNGGTKRLTLTVTTTALLQTGKSWRADAYVTIRTIGAGGTMIMAGNLSSDAPTFGAASFNNVVNTATTAIDTTAAHTLTFGFNNGTAAAGNTLRAELADWTREKL